MAKLILSLDGAQLREIPLTKERTTIGRKAHNDVVIDNLAVSGEHAMIMTILNDSFLEDLGSTNGTVVNGQTIKKHFLQNGDVIELGKYKLKFIADVPVAQASQPDFEKTMVLRSPIVQSRPGPAAAAPRDEARSAAIRLPGDVAGHAAPVAGRGPAVAPEALVVAPEALAADVESLPPAGPGAVAASAAPAVVKAAPAAPPVPCGTIQILSGVNAGRELQLTKALTTLGKPGVQVAVIAKRPQGYFITHVEGVDFPAVNGRQLDAQAHPLQDHDIIELGGVKMEFFLKPA